MDKIDEMLKYVRRTNPEMTRDKLIEELGKCYYSAKALIFEFQNVRDSFIIADIRHKTSRNIIQI